MRPALLSICLAFVCFIFPAYANTDGDPLAVVPADWATLNDCVADATSAIQAAINSKRRVLLPDRVNGTPGCYRITKTLTMISDGQTFSGTGWTELRGDAPTKDLIDVGISDGSAITSSVTIEGLRLTTTSSRTNGSTAIALHFVRYVTLRNLQVGNDIEYANGRSFYDGVTWRGFAYVRMENVAVVGANRNGVTASGNTGMEGKVGEMGTGLSIDGQSRIVACTNFGLYLGGNVGGINLGDVDISKCGVGVKVSRALVDKINPQLFLSERVSIDFSTNAGLAIDPNSVINLRATGSWFASTTNGPNVEVRAPQATGVFEWTGVRNLQSIAGFGYFIADGNHVFSGGSTQINHLKGIYITGGNAITIGGMFIYNNGEDGVSVNGVSNLTMQGNTVKGNNACGLRIVTPASSTSIVSGNAFSGNTTTGAACNSSDPDSAHVFGPNAGTI